MTDLNRESKTDISNRYEKLSEDFSVIVKERLRIMRENNSDYQKLEQGRVIKIVYGTALANVFAIFNLQKDPNVIFYISSLIWTLSSYMSWFYYVRFIFQSQEFLHEIVFLDDLLQNYKDDLNIHEDNLEVNKERIIKFSQSNDQEMLDYFNGQHLRIQKDIDENKNKINLLPKAIDDLKQVKLLSDQMTKNFDRFYIPTLIISWFLSIAGVFLSSYLDLIYLPQVWGITVISCSFMAVIGLWVYFKIKDFDMKARYKKFESTFRNLNKIDESTNKT